MASIPHHWYRRTELGGYEGFYASVFYAFSSALVVEVKVEEPTNRGRLDMAVVFEGRCYLFEFKMVEGEGGVGHSRSLRLEGIRRSVWGGFGRYIL